MKRFFIPTLIAIAFLATLTYQSFAAHFIDGQSDFRSFYAAGYILRTGHTSRLYDYDFQVEIQRQIVGGNEILPFLHPPHEAVLFVPFSYVPFRVAYVLFALLNLSLLALSYLFLQPKISFSAHAWLPFAIFATFLPVSATILEGQDSILFLVLLSLATVYLDNNDLLAGALVGLGLFRFQLALPILLVFLLWRRWRFAGGFAITGTLSFVASLATVGWAGITQYMHTLSAISLHLGSSSQMLMLEVFPDRMGNLRGLVYGLFRNLSPTSLFVITAILSVAVIAIAASSSRHTIAIAVTAAVLVSYHSMNHDLVLLLIPIFAALSSDRRTLKICGLLVFATPFIFILALPYQYLTAIPILALLIVSRNPSRHGRPSRDLPNKTNGAAVQTTADV